MSKDLDESLGRGIPNLLRRSFPKDAQACSQTDPQMGEVGATTLKGKQEQVLVGSSPDRRYLGSPRRPGTSQ